MAIKFQCITDSKKKYYEVKAKVNFHKGTILNEKTMDLNKSFESKFEVVVHGRTLYLELEESGLCKALHLLQVS